MARERANLLQIRIWKTANQINETVWRNWWEKKKYTCYRDFFFENWRTKKKVKFRIQNPDEECKKEKKWQQEQNIIFWKSTVFDEKNMFHQHFTVIDKIQKNFQIRSKLFIIIKEMFKRNRIIAIEKQRKCFFENFDLWSSKLRSSCSMKDLKKCGFMEIFWNKKFLNCNSLWNVFREFRNP